MQNALLRIGQKTTIDPNSEILLDENSSLLIGEDVFIGKNCNLRVNGKICIGNHVRIAQMVSLIGGQYSFRSKRELICAQPFQVKGVTIGDDVWIGVGAVVLPGVSVGTGAVVGAGTIVTKSVAPYSIVVGNPMRLIGERK
jgi:acetyltransferase-like isoleucine patch superfamily enzyme